MSTLLLISIHIPIELFISADTTWFYSAFGSSPPKMKYLLAVFVILESFLSIEAAAGKTLYFRSFNHLWKIKIPVLKKFIHIYLHISSFHAYMYFDENFNQIHFRTFYISSRFFKKKIHLPLNIALSAVYKLNRILLTSSVFFSPKPYWEKKILNIEFVNFLRLRFIE